MQPWGMLMSLTVHAPSHTSHSHRSIPSMEPEPLAHADSAPEACFSQGHVQEDRPTPGLAPAVAGVAGGQGEELPLVTVDPLFLNLFHACRDIAKRSMVGPAISAGAGAGAGAGRLTNVNTAASTGTPNSLVLSGAHNSGPNALTCIVNSTSSPMSVTMSSYHSMRHAQAAEAAGPSHRAEHSSNHRAEASGNNHATEPRSGHRVDYSGNNHAAEPRSGQRSDLNSIHDHNAPHDHNRSQALTTYNLWSSLLNININSMRGGQGRDGEQQLQVIGEAYQSSGGLHRGFSRWDTQSTQ